MTESAFTDLPALAQQSLAKLSRAIDGIHPIDVKEWVFQVAELPVLGDRPTILAEVAGWADKSKLSVYYFDCVSPDVDLAAIVQTFADAKAHERNDRAYPRLNQQNQCLYVGSSQSVSKRLSEHLGYGAARTYALQLLHWARPLNLKLRFVCAKYGDKTDYEVVQALEDALWQNKKPMFGRQGRK